MRSSNIHLFVALVLIIYANCSGVPKDTRQSKSDELLWDILNECLNGVESVSSCLKIKVLKHYDYNMEEIATPRSLSQPDETSVDRKVIKRFQKYIRKHGFEVQLPEFLFQGATLVFKPGKDLSNFDVKFPQTAAQEGREVNSARDLMKDKMLLPLLLMLKMKLKMMTPLMLTLVSIKATKALLMSKLALMLVVSFLASQLFKKLGMKLTMVPSLLASSSAVEHSMPMSMTMPPQLPMITTPATSYGPPPPSNSYGEPPSNWEPSASSSNTFSRTWDPHQMAYSSYYNNISSQNTNNKI